MSNQSFTKTFLYTLLITSLIFGVMKLNFPSHAIKISNQMRMLETKKTAKQMTDEMCEKSSSDLNDFYSKNKDFNFKGEKGDSFLIDTFTKLVNGESNIDIGKDEVIKYAKDNGIYVLCLVLFILLVILWIPYSICVCLKKCMCIPDTCGDKLKCIVFLSVIISGAVMICCFIGYSKNGDIVNVVYGLGCSILKIEQHVVNGDDYTAEKPYWIGLNSVIEKLDDTEKDIQTISDNTEMKQKLVDTKGLFGKFRTELDNEYVDKKARQITNPTNGEKSTPEYLNKYNDTCLTIIRTELNEVEFLTVKKMDEVINVVDIKGQTKDIISNINSISKELNKTIGEVETTIENNIGTHYHLFDDVDSYVRRIMNVLFSLNLALIIAFTVSILMLIFCECVKCGAILICIFWFFIYIFMLLSFLLGAILGLLSSIAKDSSLAIKTVSEDPSIIKSGSLEKDILDICLNGNGSLSTSSLIPIDFNKSLVDDIYFLENKINEGIKLIENNLNYTSIELNYYTYDKIKEYPDKFISDLSIALYNINEKNSIIKEHKDVWKTNKDNCTGDYHYLAPPSTSSRNLKEENENEVFNCLVIREWTEEQIKERYGDNSDINTAKKNIDNCLDDNDKLIDEIINKNGVFKDKFVEIKDSEIGFLNYTLSVITPLRNIYIEYISEGSIFDILNCGFIKRDFNKVIDTLYTDFAGDFKMTSNLFLAISAIELILTIFVLIIMKAVKAESSDIFNYDTYAQA